MLRLSCSNKDQSYAVERPEMLNLIKLSDITLHINNAVEGPEMLNLIKLSDITLHMNNAVERPEMLNLIELFRYYTTHKRIPGNN